MQRLSIRIKDANSHVKWGRVSKATVFPWVFVRASNRKIALELKPCFIYRGNIQHCNLCWHGQTQQLIFLRAAVIQKLFQVPRTGCWTGNTSPYEGERGKSDWENYRQLLWFGAAILPRCTSNNGSDRRGNNWKEKQNETEEQQQQQQHRHAEVRRFNETPALQQRREGEDGQMDGRMAK